MHEIVGVDVDLASLRRVVGGGSHQQGINFARRGAVQHTSWDRAHGVLSGTVRGDDGRQYRATAVFAVTGGLTAKFSHSHCGCAIGYDCKHVVALVYSALPPEAPAAGKPTPAGSHAPAAASEQPGHSLEPDTSGGAVPLAIQVDLEDGPGWERRLTAKLLRSDQRGGWTNERVTWGNVHDDSHLRDHDERQLRVLRALLQVYQRSGGRIRGYDRSIDLSAIDSPLLWTLLRAVAAAGLPVLYPRADGAVPACCPGRFYLDLTRDQAGELRISSVVLNADREPLVPVAFLGAKGEGAVCVPRDQAAAGTSETWRFLLVQLVEPVLRKYQRMALAGNSQRIPADEERAFSETYYPRLRRWVDLISSDDSFVPPEISGPELVMRLYRVSGPCLELEVAWEWAYQVGDTALRASLMSRAEDDDYRDLGAERALLDRLELPLERHRLGSHGGADGSVPVLASCTRLAGADAIRFIRELPLLQGRPGLRVEVGGGPAEFREATGPLLITLSTDEVSGHSDWFDLEVTVTIEGHDIPFRELFMALNRGDEYLMLANGTFFSLDRPELAKLARLIEEASELNDQVRVRVHRHQVGLLNELASLGVPRHEMSAWRQRAQDLRLPGAIDPPAPPAALRGELRPHQKDGFAWLAWLWRHRLGGILADEMGLGKTLQCLSLICHAREREPDLPPFLIVAPTSVAANWIEEAGKFTPDLKVVQVKRTTEGRRQTLGELVRGSHAVVTTYTLLRLDFDAYQEVTWSGLLIDEAQQIKSAKTDIYRCVRRLATPVKIAITGTPLENKLMELWSLLSVTAPGLFPRSDGFLRYYALPIEHRGDDERLAHLQRRIRPLVLRRTKDQAARELPQKREQVLKVDLHTSHQEVYQRNLQRERLKILNLVEDVKSHRFTILSSLTLLRMLSLHAGLVDDAYADVPSAKIDALLDQLHEVSGDGHRALVFSQFTKFLGKIGTRLENEGVPHCYLDGQTKDRAGIIQKFKAGSAPVFLISLKAGGSGLNLTEADHCYLLDPWWNPATEAQAVDRAHRIGQTRPVNVFRLVAANTIEEKVLELQARKAHLFSSVMMDDRRAFGTAITADDIRGIISEA